ncbi:hypothetical protein GCK32_007006 [Trichostrongylus colubriformis]|uniref:Uncharacterized protein n=1 Tax=Trichostrongylus colubriformis TaxID=6319 RepID=A0AAN8ICX5_TRICO
MLYLILTFFHTLLVTQFILLCCRQEKKQFPKEFMEGYGGDQKESNESKEPKEGSQDERGPSDEKVNIRAPEEKRVVPTFDPNYQTLAGLNNADIFQNKVISIQT